jgi:uncharacterized membrane protein required for colicin V production
VIPFLKTINRVAGACLGFLEGGLVLGLILLYASQQSFFSGWLNNSQVTPFQINFTKAILPLLPQLMEKFKGLG